MVKWKIERPALEESGAGLSNFGGKKSVLRVYLPRLQSPAPMKPSYFPTFAHLLLLISLLMMFTLSSCYVTKYEYSTNTSYKHFLTYFESSDSDLDSNFVFKDENLKITYSIQKREFTFEIENLSNKPIFLDVARSSLIVNKQALNYLKTLDSKERFYYIPSKSVHVMRDFSNLIPRELTNNKFKSNGLDTQFTEENSPLSMRNQITYGFDEAFSNSKIVDNHIWLAKFGSCDAHTYYQEKNRNSAKVSAERIAINTQEQVKVRKYSRGRTFALVFPIAMSLALTGLIIGVTR